ncbi:MAG TPA: hypothetical protein VN734_09600 [Acidobacteriaceae bacterium]|nr:hypothetical protein [Acidobacteriaceae bacterium]
MRVFWRVVIVLAVFAVVSYAASHVVMAHELAKPNVPFAEVRLVSWMAGLFGGSLAAVLVGIALLIKR